MGFGKFSLVSALLVVVLLVGCNPADNTGSKSTTQKNQPASSGNQGHRHGPNHGEIFEFKEAGIIGECKPKYEQNLVVFYILNDDEKTERRIKAEKLVASFKAGAKEMTFDIAAVDADADGMVHRFEIQDEQLALAAGSTGFNLAVEIDGKKHTVFVPKDPHAKN